jgi:hypothetical protein
LEFYQKGIGFLWCAIDKDWQYTLVFDKWKSLKARINDGNKWFKVEQNLKTPAEYIQYTSHYFHLKTE